MTDRIRTGRPATPTPGERDLSRGTRSFFANWGPAILLITAGSVFARVPGTPLLVFGLLWSMGTIWSGVSCARNALRCGRFHCTVLGIAHPLLGVAAFAITFHLLPLPWDAFWTFVFWPVTALAFVPEFFGLRYFHRMAHLRVDRPRADR